MTRGYGRGRNCWLRTWVIISKAEASMRACRQLGLDMQACGSGNTAAGLALGLHLSALPWRLHANS